MAKAKQKKATIQPKERFHERFQLQVSNVEAQRKFVNRVQNQIFDEFLNDESSGAWIHNKAIHRDVANAFGDQFEPLVSLSFYVGSDFHKCLHAIEAIHRPRSGRIQ